MTPEQKTKAEEAILHLEKAILRLKESTAEHLTPSRITAILYRIDDRIDVARELIDELHVDVCPEE